MTGWENVTTIIGCVSIVTAGAVGIFKTARNGKEPQPMSIEEDYSGRVSLLEAHAKRATQDNERLQKAVDEQRHRHDQVVDGIYSEIGKLRQEIIRLIKNQKGDA